jgi:hypothetical protein
MATKERIAKVYLDTIQGRLGLDAAFDGEAVRLTLPPGSPAVIELYENDPEYLRVVTIVPSVGQELAKEQIQSLCATETLKLKGAKAVVDDDRDLILAVEMVVAGAGCLPDPGHLQDVLPRALGMLTHALCSTVMAIQLAGMLEATPEA